MNVCVLVTDLVLKTFLFLRKYKGKLFINLTIMENCLVCELGAILKGIFSHNDFVISVGAKFFKYNNETCR